MDTVPQWRWLVNDTSALRTTLRQLSEADDAHERARLHDLLASQLEVAFNQIGNNTQVVLWDVQEKAYQKIDHLQEQIGNNNTLLSGVIEALNGLRGDVQSSAAESAARLGKLEDGQVALAGQVNTLSEDMEESKADRRGLRADFTALREEFAAYVKDSKRDEVEDLKAQIREMRGDYTPEERQRLTNTLLRMIADYEAAHGDGRG